MLITGKEQVERRRHGRAIYIDTEAPWDAFHASVDGPPERVQTPDSRGHFRASPRQISLAHFLTTASGLASSDNSSSTLSKSLASWKLR
jgi:hypothetical protein